MTTQRLYYQHNLLSCSARVLACEKEGTSFRILLDSTVIFPEGGGQLSDTGAIDGVNVSHAYEDGEKIWHVTDKPLEVNKQVEVRLNWETRLDHSQQHTGEHIISGLAKTMFGATNVGFHMAADYATLDLDILLSSEEIDKLEQEANRAVQRNTKTECVSVTPEELENMELRKRAAGLTGEIRIVYAGGVDSCTCCGTHCEYSGEVGAVKIVSHAKYKSGVRIFFACGMRAVKNARENADIVSAIARRFSMKGEDVLNAVVRQGDELVSIKRELKRRTEALLTIEAERLLHEADEVKNVKLVLYVGENLAMPELNLLAEKLCTGSKCVAVLFSQNDDTLIYQLYRSDNVSMDMREVSAAVNAMTDGKGGGREGHAQGSAKLRSGFDNVIEQLKAYLQKRMGA